MNCPACGYENYTKVLDSRSTDKGIERRRECINCLTRFKTVETIEHVIKPYAWRKRKSHGESKQVQS